MLYLPSEAGQGLVEYGLILVLVSIAAVAIMAVTGGAIGDLFNTVSQTLNANS